MVDAGIFALLGFQFQGNRIYFGPFADINYNSNPTVAFYRVGGEIRFDAALGLSINPFTRLQYGYTWLNGEGMLITNGTYDVTGRGFTFRWLGGIAFPLRGKVVFSIEAGVLSGAIDVIDSRFLSGVANIAATERKDLFGILFGLSVGYRFLE